MNSKVQYGVWIFLSLTAPLAVVAGKSAWVWVLLIGAVCCPVRYFVDKLREKEKMGYALAGFQIIVLSLVAGEMARWSGYCWPQANNHLVIPVMLLIVAAFSAWKGVGAASSVAGALVWLVVALYFAILFAGAADVNMRWLKPERGLFSYGLVFVFLLPCAVCVLPGKWGKKHIGAVLLFALAISLCVTGVLSSSVIKQENFPFYTFSKSLSFLGVVERFEALVCTALSLGFFSLISMLFTSAGTVTQAVLPEKYRCGVLAATAMAVLWLLLSKGLSELLLAVLAFFSWVAIPLLRAGYLHIKKGKNSKNIS